MAARQVQQPSQAPFILLGGLILAGGAFYTGWPGVPAIWLALIVTAWMEPPVTLTGRKDASGYPTPAGPGEERNLQRFSMWRELKWRLIVPNPDWAPGWPVLGSFIGALVAAAAAFTIPTIDTTLRFANAGAAFLIVAVLMGVRRRTLAEDMCPGARVKDLPELAKSKPQFVAAGLVAAGIVGVAAHIFIPVWDPSSAGEAGPATTARVDPESALSPLVDYGTRTPQAATISLAVLAFLAVIAVPWTNKAIGHWRTVVAARKEWRPRWEALKFDPPPFLIDRQEVDSAVVFTFMAPSGQGAAAFYPLVPKIQPTVGAGSRIAILETPNEGPDGPVPGTIHPLRFEVVVWPMDDFPDLAEPNLDPELVALATRCALSWTAEAAGFGRPVLLGIEPVHAPGSAASAWESKWAFPLGADLKVVREAALGSAAGSLGCEALIDHRRDSLFFGALLAGAPDEWQENAPLPFPELFENLQREDEWEERWRNVLKQGAHAPLPEHSTASVALLSDGTEVHRQAFVTRMGIDPREFATGGMEKKIATALSGVPFCAVGGWTQTSDRAGERHAQALVVYWSRQPVPGSPQSLAPTPSAMRGMRATDWVLIGHINKAFDGARLPRPEIASSTCLTEPEARRGHIWEIRLRLHDGVTLSDVRGAVGRLKSSLGVNWLRVAPDDLGCVLFVGANPRNTKLLRPARDSRRLKGLDWEQAWLDSGVSGVGGILPKLTAASVLPSNEQVEVLDFKLPTGVDMATVKNAVSKLMASTNNAFVEVRPGPDASTARLLVCEVNPLPERVGFDFDFIDQSDKIPFATGVEGDPIEFDHTESPHALIAGTTGSGKSVLAQAFLYGAIIRGWDVYVIDPVKSGADFVFAKDRCRAFAATPFEAAGVMKAVYEDVVQRKNLNAAHGVGSIDELPDDVRPPHVFVFIDEFTSLMGKSLVPKTDDPSMQAEIEAIEAENHARTEIGVFAGKLAREARSAGVHLGLGTQKLTAKMLDSVPGGGDLKEVSLDSLLPVPVSDRFPTGWARNRDLVEGDVVFAVDGSQAKVIALSEVVTDHRTFEVTFEDGQVVTAGAGHWWTVASADTTAVSSAFSDADTETLTTDEILGRFDERWMVPVADPIQSDFEVRGDAFDAGRATGSGDLVISRSWLRAKLTQRQDFYRGWCEARPGVTAQGGWTILSPGSRVVSAFITELARSLGLIVRASGSAPDAVLIVHDRSVRWNRIVSIVDVVSAPMRCIGIDHPDHLFLVEGFIPTHNTNLARTLLGKGSFGDRASALRAPDDAPRLDGEVPKGRGLWEPLSSAAMVVQTWFESQETLRDALVARVPEMDSDRYIDLSQFAPAEESDDFSSPSPVASPGQVIELEGLELSLDDLELSLDDLDAFVDDEVLDAEESAPEPSTDGFFDSDDIEDADEPLGDEGSDVKERVSADDIFSDGIELAEGSFEPATGIDDLDWDLDDLEGSDSSGHPVPSAPEPFTRTMFRSDTVVFLGVDGVLVPHQDPPPTTWGDWTEIPGLAQDLNWGSPEMCRRVAGSGAQLVWLTSYGPGPADSSFADLLGGPLERLSRGAAAYGWWKIDAALAWLSDHPEIRRVVWFDDELEAVDSGIHRCDTMSTMLEMLDVEHLLVAPKAIEALSPTDIAEMEEWLDETDPEELAPAPAAPEVPTPSTAETDDDDPFAGPAWELPVDADDPF